MSNLYNEALSRGFTPGEDGTATFPADIYGGMWAITPAGVMTETRYYWDEITGGSEPITVTLNDHEAQRTIFNLPIKEVPGEPVRVVTSSARKWL